MTFLLCVSGWPWAGDKGTPMRQILSVPSSISEGGEEGTQVRRWLSGDITGRHIPDASHPVRASDQLLSHSSVCKVGDGGRPGRSLSLPSVLSWPSRTLRLCPRFLCSRRLCAELWERGGLSRPRMRRADGDSGKAEAEGTAGAEREARPRWGGGAGRVPVLPLFGSDTQVSSGQREDPVLAESVWSHARRRCPFRL